MRSCQEVVGADDDGATCVSAIITERGLPGPLGYLGVTASNHACLGEPFGLEKKQVHGLTLCFSNRYIECHRFMKILYICIHVKLLIFVFTLFKDISLMKKHFSS